MPEDQVIEGTVELTATLNEERCWPSHHDYQQAHETDPPLMYCRLCGDVMAIALPTATED
jgi:hypothetical protein